MISPFVAAVVLGRYPSDPIIVALRERLETAEAVAMAKFNSGAPIEDRIRERSVIFAAVHIAAQAGVDTDWTVRVIKAQIEANKIAQHAFIDRWKGRPKLKHAPDLAQTIRPKLDSLTRTIVLGLRKHDRWPRSVLLEGPKDDAYRLAWYVATSPIVRVPEVPKRRVTTKVSVLNTISQRYQTQQTDRTLYSSIVFSIRF
ncbi:MAG: chorismate mutase [Fimbriimonas sp.]|nr:chorismate mutase [Fimbriimonas sp.]